MLSGCCVRISLKSTSSAWLRSLPAADSRDVAGLNMDLIEGRVRYRKGKKWKVRWAVLRRVNPATDVLNLVMYPDRHADQPIAGVRHKALLCLKGFSGLHVLNKMDKHFNVIVIITTDDVIPMSFETIHQRAEWLAILQGYYGKEQSFQGIVPHKQKIKAGEAVLRFYSTFFSLTKKDNYRLIGHWKFTALPKYGAVEGGFAFQAKPDSTSGDKLFTYFFATRSGREIQQLFDNVCRADEVLPSQEYQSDSNQPGTSEEENKPQPSFLRRAWLRMSGKRPRRDKSSRPRSRSMPSTAKKKKENIEQRSRIEQDNRSVRRNESVPANLGASSNPTDSLNEVFASEEKPDTSPKSPPPGYQNIAGVTPEGYEVMMPEEDKPLHERKRSATYGSARKESTGQKKSDSGQSQADGGQVGEVEGYVVVEGRDEELLEKIRTNSYGKEARNSRGSNSGRIKSSASDKRQSDRGEENGVIREEEEPEKEEQETEKEERKKSETEKQRASNGEAKCPIIVTTTPETDEENINDNKDELTNGDDVFETVAEGNKRNRSGTNEKPSPSADYVNGGITLKNKDKMNMDEKQTNGAPASVSTRRGMKNPPTLSFPPTTTVSSAEHLYVNSPKIVDYVNVKGGRAGPGVGRRGKSGASKSPGSKSKLNPYAMYDGNDDSIYHSVESLMPSHPGYINVFNNDPSRSHSFENIAGHSYANVAGAQPSYQNIGHIERSYVNVMSRPHQGDLNYIRLEGVDSPHASSPLASTSPKSAKPSSDYTWIDERKTRLLADTAKMHSERRQENLPRMMKK